MHGSTSCSTVCARRDCSGCRNRTEREWKHSLQSVEKQHFDSCASCGSTHKIEFAKQIHKFREHGPDHPLLPLCGNSPCVSRNLYKGRKNVPVRARFFFSIRSKAWFRARGCSKNDSFSTASEDCKRSPLSLSIKSSYRFYFSCGSTHKIEFAQQIHNSRGRVPRELYKGRKIVPVGRGFSSRFD